MQNYPPPKRLNNVNTYFCLCELDSEDGKIEVKKITPPMQNKTQKHKSIYRHFPLSSALKSEKKPDTLRKFEKNLPSSAPTPQRPSCR